MNQKEYELIAYILKRARKWLKLKPGEYETLVELFRFNLSSNHPKTFDEDKFKKACGL